MTQPTHLRLVLSSSEGRSELLSDAFSPAADNLHIHLHVGTPVEAMTDTRALPPGERQGQSGKRGTRPVWLGLAIIVVAAGSFRFGLIWGDGNARVPPDYQAGLGPANAVVPGLQSVLPGSPSGAGSLEAVRQQLAAPPIVTGPATPAASGADAFGRQR